MSTSSPSDLVQFREQVLSTRILTVVEQWLRLNGRLRIRFSPYVVALIIEVALGLLTVALWRVTNTSVSSSGATWTFLGDSIAGVCLLAVHVIVGRFLERLAEYQETIFGANRDHLTAWVKRNANMRAQILFSSFFAVGFFPFSFPFFAAVVGVRGEALVSPILLLNLFFIGNAVYWITVMPTATATLYRHAQAQPYFDPRNVEWINGLLEVYQLAALATSFISVLVTVPVILAPNTNFANFGISVRAFSLIWLAVTFTLVLLPYATAHSNLSAWIRRERLRSITAIQAAIYRSLIVHDVPFENDRVGRTMELYALAISSKKSIWRVGSNVTFLYSLLFPALSFLIINLAQIEAFINAILAIFT